MKKLSATSESDEETVENVDWISNRHHFFSAILIPNSERMSVDLKSKDLSGEVALEERYTKSFTTSFEVNRSGDNLNDSFQFYYGPTDYKTLKALDGDLENSISLGWGIFGWINRVIFLPLFGFLSSFLSYGIAIIVYAIVPVIRLTDLGIRLVDQDVVEAANAFGMSSRQKLLGIELPLALPNIMAGVNQTIMMSLAMVVIASLVSAPGLGVLVLRGIRNLELGVGLIAGLGIVLLAVILDRVSKAAIARVSTDQTFK
ncbi:MAG: ABC transporter permease subunit [Rhodobacterales bacterium]|nr:ABC transporter permease subunit [Rhodobacterales bacterium]